MNAHSDGERVKVAFLHNFSRYADRVAIKIDLLKNTAADQRVPIVLSILTLPIVTIVDNKVYERRAEYAACHEAGQDTLFP